MEFLLPFDDDEAWNHLEDGWELHEHSDRREQLEQREKEVAEIKAKFPKGKSKANDAKRESELTSAQEQLARNIRAASVMASMVA